MTRTDWAVSTKNKYLITAKILLRELARLGTIPDITQNIKTFNQNRCHKKDGIGDEEMRRLVELLHQLPPTPQTARLKVIVALLALNGLRQCECVRLNVNNLDLVAKTAMIKGKGQDDLESIDLQPQTVLALQEYLKSNKVADGPLFTSQSNHGRGKRLTTRALQQIVKKLFGELNINRGLHSFRHRFVTKLVSVYKGDLTTVMRYSRHKTLAMITVYHDNVARKTDLPRFYSAFSEVRL
jgi:integrase